MINLLVIDDHPVTIFGVQNYLEDSIKIIYSATTIKNSLNFDTNKFDIILLDLYIEGTNPVNNINILKSVYTNKPIVIFTCETSSMWKKKMYKYGVQGYLAKTSNKNQIISTLEIIMNNI
jgi:two-component system competent response regulator ComA